MVKVGDELFLPERRYYEDKPGHGKEREPARYVKAKCIYVHPTGRFATFDFGYYRETFSRGELATAGG